MALEALSGGGLEEVVALLIQGLPSRGITAAAMVKRADGASFDRFERLGVPVLVARTSREAEARLREFDADLVLGHNPPLEFVAGTKRAGIPYVEVIHVWPTAWVEAEQDRRRARLSTADGVVTVSSAIAELMGTFGVAPGRVWPIPNATDPSRYDTVDRTTVRRALGLSDELLLVSLGRFELQKNAYGLLCAFDALARKVPDAHLIVAGDISDPVYALRVLQLSNSLDSGDRVHLRGFSPQPQLLLWAADVFVMDSFWEAWPMASMEALIAGTPVVMSDVGGAHEQVGQAGDRGYVVGNPAGPRRPDAATMARAKYQTAQPNRGELVEALEMISESRIDWRSRRPELRQDAICRFSYGNFLDRYATVIRRVTSTSVRNRFAQDRLGAVDGEARG